MTRRRSKSARGLAQSKTGRQFGQLMEGTIPLNIRSAWLFSAWLLFILLALSATAQPVEPDASYTRTVDTSTPSAPVVTVAVTNAVGVSCFTMEEILPACATATVLTGNGVYLPALHVIRWGPYLNQVGATNTYQLTGLPANYPVNGGAWMDGQWYFSPGVTMIQVLPPSSATVIPVPPTQVAAPVISPASGVVSGTSVNVTIQDSDTTTAAGAIIYYTTDGSLPTSPTSNPNSKPYSAGALNNLPLPSVVRAVAIPSAASGWVASVATLAYYGAKTVVPNPTVMRSTDTMNQGSPAMPVMSLTVTPPSGAQCIAVTETLPAGLAANNVMVNGKTGLGNYIASQNVVEWGPFFGTAAQTLSYQAEGLAGTYPVRATWSVDGTNGSEATAYNLVIASPAATVIPVPPTQVAAPAISPASGVVSGTSVNVTIQDSDTTTAAGAIIYYTTDGSLPASASNPNSKPYSAGALNNLPLPSVVRAVAIPSAASGWVASVATLAYYGAKTVVPNPTVMRSTDTMNQGSPAMPVMSLTVTPPSGAQCIAVTETLPAGLAANNVMVNGKTGLGNYIASQNVVEWGPFFGTAAQTLSYQAEGLAGTYPVRATWSVDGTNGSEATAYNLVIASPAATVIPVPPTQLPAPVFSPPSGATVPAGGLTVGIVPPINAPPNYVIRYTLDGTMPGQSSSQYKVLFNLPAGSSTTLRAVAFDPSGVYLPSVATVAYYGPPPPADAAVSPPTFPVTGNGNGTTQPIISLTATPQPYMVGNTKYAVQCYSVVETIPYGLTTSFSSLSVMINNPSGGSTPDPSGVGFWDPVASVIRWGPYLDNKSRTFSFQVSGASGSYALSSLFSYDGYSATTPGSVQVNMTPDTTPPTVAITSEKDGSTVDSANLLVSGTATDSDGISLVTVNGAPASNDTASGGATANWSATVPLHTGANTIIAVASDTLNNTASAQITLYYNPPTFGSSSVSSSGGGQQTLTTTLSGLTSGETVTVYQFTDLSDLNNPSTTWTQVPQSLPGFPNPTTASGSTLNLSIPITPGSSGPYYIFTVTPAP